MVQIFLMEMAFGVHSELHWSMDLAHRQTSMLCNEERKQSHRIRTTGSMTRMPCRRSNARAYAFASSKSLERHMYRTHAY